MRRLGFICTLIALVLCLAVNAFAATGASSVNSFATVSTDGGCDVTMTATVHLEQAMEKLYFPIPAEAAAVSLNGSRVRASKLGDVRRIDLSRVVKNVVGDVTVSIHYSLYDVIHTTEAGTLEMRIPLLSGFEYPVESLSFSVTMPGALDVLPGFVSGYHQARIEEDLVYTVEGATISGNSLKALKDHETLTMTLVVTEEMFPQSIAQTQDYQFGFTAMGICAGLALLYWLITMFNLPVWPQRCTEPPQGYTAGQLGCIAAGQGVDLSLAVLSWAQLGYILIKAEHSRVLLYKRMDMGNERSEAERRIFKKLFGKRDMVDTGSYQYALLCRAEMVKPVGVGELMRKFTGNPMVFRALIAGIGMFGGAGLAVALANGAALQGVLVFVLGAAGAFSGWVIQGAGGGILLGSGRKVVIGLALSVAWLLLSLTVGAFAVGAWMIVGLLLGGVILAWGGRRTELGRSTLSQVMGLRRYLRRADKQQIRRICETDPDYFFRLVPYAMALGADKAFAKGFGAQKLGSCPYLITGASSQMTALQWSETIRKTVALMDRRADKLPVEKLIRLLSSLTK